MDFRQPDIPWVRAYAFIWPETCIQWRKQGYEGPELGWHGEGLPERFDNQDLVIMGGIDKRKLAIGGETMRKEVDRVMPLVEDGGYFPEADHSIPPDVSWPGFIDYVEYLKTRLGRG